MLCSLPKEKKRSLFSNRGKRVAWKRVDCNHNTCTSCTNVRKERKLERNAKLNGCILDLFWDKNMLVLPLGRQAGMLLTFWYSICWYWNRWHQKLFLSKTFCDMQWSMRAQEYFKQTRNWKSLTSQEKNALFEVCNFSRLVRVYVLHQEVTEMNL